MKVLHLPTSVGGNSWQLSRSERELGLYSDVLYQSQNWLGYPADIILDKSNFYPAMFAKSVFAAFTIPKKYDVLHFNFGSTLIDIPERGIHHWDLPLYKNKRICVTYNGCDARMKYRRTQDAKICPCMHKGCQTALCKTEKLDACKEKRMQQFKDVGATFFALNPDYMRYMPKNTIFLPYTITGWHSLNHIPILQNIKEPIKIVHAPTNQVIKATKPLLDAIQRLKCAYPNKIELTLVEGMSHSEALVAYGKADLVVDQLRLGWFGAFAIEAMKMGKPVITYIHHDDLGFLPPQLAKDTCDTFIEANEFTIESVLQNCIENPHFLLDKSAASLDYVNRWYNPINTAKITKSAYES